MSGRIHRLMRKQAAHVSAQHSKLMVPAIQAIADNVDIALKNEELTRGRVERLEAVVGRPTLWGRLTWLLWGR